MGIAPAHPMGTGESTYQQAPVPRLSVLLPDLKEGEKSDLIGQMDLN